MSTLSEFSLVHQLVEAQVEKTPDNVAVLFEEQYLTYRELNQKANQLAHYLMSFEVKPDTLIGVCLERSFDLIITLLAILKAGCAYLPIDTSYPLERSSFMLEDSQAFLLLTQKHLSEQFNNIAIQKVNLDTDIKDISQRSQSNPSVLANLESLAYVIYTSGSTGKPKGVAMPHRALANLLLWQQNSLKLPQARTLQFTPISFDVSFQEIFSTLSTGGTLVLISDSVRRNAEALLQYISKYTIERLFLPFVALQHLAEVAKEETNLSIHLQEVITAGEQLKVTRSISQWFSQLENCTLHNHYGPSESHVVTSFTLSGSPKDWPHLPPIGKPISNTQIYLLKPNRRRKEDVVELAQPGEAGELAIGGVAVARGYLNQPELTNIKFVDDPFSSVPGAKLYRTGDMVRYGLDGNLEYVERIDDQVKIRGVRIELGEIEACLCQHRCVKDAVVIAHGDHLGSKRLVAYIVTVSTNDFHALELELRTFLQQRLPECMIPSIFMLMPMLPLTPSGKIDRRALPSPKQSRPALKEEFVAPNTDCMQKLSQIWTQVLGISPIGVNDNFFELGGDSLKAIQLIQRVRDIFHLNVPIVTIFEKPTIAKLSEFVEMFLHSGSMSTNDDITVQELEAEAKLPDCINANGLFRESLVEPENILITGVTGFLGAFLLYELLEQTQAQIYCLVRAKSLADGSQKIQNNLSRYLLWNPSYHHRITPVLGDLAKPRLGISEQEWHTATKEIDVIYHNGASISLIHPYSALRDANVLGTRELLKLASQNKLKPIHFISTLDVFQTSLPFSTHPILEDSELNPHEAVSFDGYTKSKWVSERMMHIAQSRGIPVTVYRPAMISGHSKTGAANAGDLMNRLIKGFIQLGNAPNFEMMINVAPVDYFSQGAIYLSRQPESLGKSFNFINPRPVPMSQFIEMINTCGYFVKQVQHEEWEELLLRHVEDLDGVVAVLTSKSSESSPSYLERSSVGANLVSSKNVLDGLSNTSIVCPEIDTILMKNWFSFLEQTGFLNAPSLQKK